MKNRTPIILTSWLLSVFMMLSSNLYAGGPVEKLARGVENIATSPMEYYTVYSRSAENSSPFVAVFKGLIYGTMLTGIRIAAGAYEVVTFPFPLPQHYEPIMDPPTPMG